MDRITLDVIGAALLTIAEEMGDALIKSSYSTNIKERQDCSTAIFDAHGEVIAQAEHIPMHLGSLISDGPRDPARAIPSTELRDGDVFIGNDPYTGGSTHLPDITLAVARLRGAARCSASSPTSRTTPMAPAARRSSICDEGLRIPPIRLVEGGRCATT